VSDLVVKAQVLAGGRGKGHFSKVKYTHWQHAIVFTSVFSIISTFSGLIINPWSKF
jgi:succinyl-CoA synthetase beta subunit